ncbi:hypothetical protein GALL_457220 [mine drainage metagenome]|uniref:Uncharacterized protein n=1 Tax=mine drainage metagenome TaxID=410659 RepID=A0A1J5PMB1_9ZZZZ
MAWWRMPCASGPRCSPWIPPTAWPGNTPTAPAGIWACPRSRPCPSSLSPPSPRPLPPRPLNPVPSRRIWTSSCTRPSSSTTSACWRMRSPSGSASWPWTPGGRRCGPTWTRPAANWRDAPRRPPFRPPVPPGPIPACWTSSSARPSTSSTSSAPRRPPSPFSRRWPSIPAMRALARDWNAVSAPPPRPLPCLRSPLSPWGASSWRGRKQPRRPGPRPCPPPLRW